MKFRVLFYSMVNTFCKSVYLTVYTIQFCTMYPIQQISIHLSMHSKCTLSKFSHQCHLLLQSIGTEQLYKSRFPWYGLHALTSSRVFVFVSLIWMSRAVYGRLYGRCFVSNEMKSIRIVRVLRDSYQKLFVWI